MATFREMHCFPSPDLSLSSFFVSPEEEEFSPVKVRREREKLVSERSHTHSCFPLHRNSPMFFCRDGKFSVERARTETVWKVCPNFWSSPLFFVEKATFGGLISRRSVSKAESRNRQTWRIKIGDFFCIQHRTGDPLYSPTKRTL